MLAPVIPNLTRSYGVGLSEASLVFVAFGAGAVAAFFPFPMSFFLASYVLVQATAGTTGGTMQVLGTDLAPASNKGRFFAVWRMLAQAGALVSPAAYAFLAEHVSYGFGFVYMAACAVLVVIGVTRILGNTMGTALAQEGLDQGGKVGRVGAGGAG